MSFAESYKICPQCDEEYLAQVERCASCGVALVFDTELCSYEETATSPTENPFASQEELVCIRVAGTTWIKKLAERFEEHALPYRIEMINSSLQGRSKLAARGELPGGVGIFVRPVDEALARQIDQEYLSHEIPGMEDFSEASGEERCPACDAVIGAADENCSTCGLTFV